MMTERAAGRLAFLGTVPKRGTKDVLDEAREAFAAYRGLGKDIIEDLIREIEALRSERDGILALLRAPGDEFVLAVYRKADSLTYADLSLSGTSAVMRAIAALQPTGGTTCTMLWHLGQARMSPITDSSLTLSRARQVVH
jgi:hypothetical protein